MEQSPVERYGLMIVLLVMVNVGMVWAQANDTPAADGSWHEEMVAFITDTATECRALPRHEYRDEYWNGARGEEEPEAITYTVREQEGITEPRPPADGVMVAEDMRCRQCRGKCAADSLARIVHDDFYCNRRYAAATRLVAPEKQPTGRARRSPPRHTVASMPRVLAAPHARLAWHLRGFVTNSREQCGLSCRSQCLGDSACLAHCQERTENCEALCKQIFQCE